MRALILTFALQLLVAPAAAAQSTLDRAAQALESDPVYVDPQAENAISSSEASALRRRVEEEAPGVLRIAILPGSAGPPEQVTRGLRSRLGGSVATIVGNAFRVDGSSEVEA